MDAITCQFVFLTSGFPHGAYQSQGHNQPELRGPSVRGHLRWWFDALTEGRDEESRIFGGLKVAGKDRAKPGPQASRVIVRVRSLGSNVPLHPASFIPHKGTQGGKKQAIDAGASFEVALLPRRGGLDTGEVRALERALDAWLLLGSVGQRANRGAGSLWPDGAPDSVDAFEARAARLLNGSRLRAAVLSQEFESEDRLRETAGDFLAADAFDGSAPFGSAKPRKPSPLRLKAVNLEGSLRLLAVFDGRHTKPEDLRQGIRRLARAKKLIGELLEKRVETLAGM